MEFTQETIIQICEAGSVKKLLEIAQDRLLRRISDDLTFQDKIKKLLKSHNKKSK
jgi:hypothetical protein